jgi:hypothetical protein
MRTNFPNVRVVGDATGPYQFTHSGRTRPGTRR